MKKALCFVIALLISVFLFGCNSTAGSKTAQGKQGKSVEDVLEERMNENGEDRPTSSDHGIEEESFEKGNADAEEVDVDLTTLSSTMVYAEVYNMMTSPDHYLGKRVRMKGAFAYGEGEDRYYFACLISDATACCSQEIEFLLKGQKKFPDDYPKPGAEITVTGVFDKYYEGEQVYVQLIDAMME